MEDKQARLHLGTVEESVQSQTGRGAGLKHTGEKKLSSPSGGRGHDAERSSESLEVTTLGHKDDSDTHTHTHRRVYLPVQPLHPEDHPLPNDPLGSLWGEDRHVHGHFNGCSFPQVLAVIFLFIFIFLFNLLWKSQLPQQTQQASSQVRHLQQLRGRSSGVHYVLTICLVTRGA